MDKVLEFILTFFGLLPTAEVGEPAAEPSPASAAAASDSSEDKPKEDAVEDSSPAPVKASAEEKTDDEGAVSNKTSVESLKENNENNSNNVDSGQRTGWCSCLHPGFRGPNV